MRITLFGTRGSVASAGPETVGYGGDTSASLVLNEREHPIILDAGSGIRRLTDALPGTDRVDVLLTHLHMDHIQGLGFFPPVFDPNIEVHIWGPASTTLSLEARLSRYLSPPLFPVLLRELQAVEVHEIPKGGMDIMGTRVDAELVCHPGPTVGYRLQENGSVLTYMPDHEPALGMNEFPDSPEWTSGHDLALGADILVHDVQYFADEYPSRQGWGHSTFEHALAFAEQAGVAKLVSFHHDPSHSDDVLERVASDIMSRELAFEFVPGKAGMSLVV